MSEDFYTLDELQRWMQAVITNPAGVAAGIESRAACDQIDLAPERADCVIAPSRALSAMERLEIYNRAYFARLLECLREQYSVLAAALGADLFDRFALNYLCAHPPQSYTLDELGARFPDFLAETRPPRDGNGPATPDWPEFMIDLARLERTVNDVFNGPGAEGKELLSAQSLRAISPDCWPETRLECVKCLRLLQLDYPASEYFTAIHNGERPPVPQPCPSYLAITRRDYRVRRIPLERPAYTLLDALAQREPIGQAIARAAAESRLPDDQLAAQIGGWFQTWSSEGFFLGITAQD